MKGQVIVTGGHMIEALATVMYDIVVSSETVRTALMNATLNDLEVEFGNILNAYVKAPVTEKVWTTLVLSLVMMPERLQ